MVTEQADQVPLRAPTTAGRPMNLKLDWRVSSHARRLLYLALASLALAVVTRRPEFVALAAPALALLSARRPSRPQSAQLELRPSASRVFEGEQIALDVTVIGQGDHEVELLLHPSVGARVVRGGDRAAFGTATLAYELTLWGRRSPGMLEVALWDRYRMFECRNFARLPEVVCFPVPAQHRRAVVLGRTANRSGDHPARSSGEGAEFAGVREYVAGDRQRSINWAATTRRGRLQVNSFGAERSQDVVLLVDITSDAGELGSTPVDHALRGALGVGRTYLEARDRVGLVLVGGWGGWLAPGLGRRQLFRMMEAMADSRVGWAAGKEVSRLPRAALPPGASVIAFSPLLEMTFVETLRDLRQRSFSVIVVDVLNVEPTVARGKIGRLAKRVWRIERQALMFSLRELGITVVGWDGKDELSVPLRPRSRTVAGSRR